MLKPQPLSATAWKTVWFYQGVHHTSAWDLSMAEIKCKAVDSQRIVVSMKASAAFPRGDQTSCFAEWDLSTVDKNCRGRGRSKDD